MRIIITLLMLAFGTPHAYGSLCAVREGRIWYPKLKAMPIPDKAMHCTLSCHLALRCSRFESWTFGRFKEFYDIFGPGNAEWADLTADDEGLAIARAGKAHNIKECFAECRKIY